MYVYTSFLSLETLTNTGEESIFPQIANEGLRQSYLDYLRQEDSADIEVKTYFFLKLTSSLIPLWSENIFGMIATLEIY